MRGALRIAWAWLVYALSYSALVVFGLPRPFYLPVEGRVVMEVPAGAIGMGWYGGLLVATAAGLIAWVVPIERVLAPSTRNAERRWVLGFLLGVASSAVVLAGFELASL